jgi:hypothetical protein
VPGHVCGGWHDVGARTRAARPLSRFRGPCPYGWASRADQLGAPVRGRRGR